MRRSIPMTRTTATGSCRRIGRTRREGCCSRTACAADQVTQVRGYADQLLRVKANPFDPSNRRISILVKNQDGDAAGTEEADNAKRAADGSEADEAARRRNKLLAREMGDADADCSGVLPRWCSLVPKLESVYRGSWRWR